MYLEVPQYLHNELKRQATNEGVSLRVYILDTLSRIVDESNKRSYFKEKDNEPERIQRSTRVD